MSGLLVELTGAVRGKNPSTADVANEGVWNPALIVCPETFEIANTSALEK